MTNIKILVIKKLYFDPFFDMFNGEILSYGISKNPSAISVLSAQKRAIGITSDCPYRRTFHSDRGWAYQMPAYSRELKEAIEKYIVYYNEKHIKEKLGWMSPVEYMFSTLAA